MTFSMLDSGLAPYLLLIIFGFIPSVVWKFAGAFFAHGIDENSELLVWMRAVATALLAGVACKLLFTPSGALVAAPMWLRFGALALGLLAYWLAGRSVAVAVIVGEAALMGVTWWVTGMIG